MLKRINANILAKFNNSSGIKINKDITIIIIEIDKLNEIDRAADFTALRIISISFIGK